MNVMEKFIAGKTLELREFQKLFTEFSSEINNDFINKYADVLHWGTVFKYYKLDEDMLRKYSYQIKDNVGRFNVAAYQELPEWFMHEFRDELMWTFLSIQQKMSRSFMKEHKDYLDFAYLPYYQDVGIELLESEHIERFVKWDVLSAHYPLTEKFILEFYKYLNIELIKNNKLIILTDAIDVLMRLNSK